MKMIQFVRGMMNHLILMLYWCLLYLAQNEGKSNAYRVASDCDIENCPKFQPVVERKRATPTVATNHIL